MHLVWLCRKLQRSGADVKTARVTGPQVVPHPTSTYRTGRIKQAAKKRSHTVQVPTALTVTKQRTAYDKLVKEHQDQLKILAEFKCMLGRVRCQWLSECHALSSQMPAWSSA